MVRCLNDPALNGKIYGSLKPDAKLPGISRRELAAHLGMSYRSLFRRLKGHAEWKERELKATKEFQTQIEKGRK